MDLTVYYKENEDMDTNIELIENQPNKRDLISLDEYLQLLKVSFKEFNYFPIKQIEGELSQQEIRRYVRLLNKNNIEINRDYGSPMVSKSTLEKLIIRILDDIRIYNNDKENEYYVDTDKFEIKDLNGFIAKTDISDVLGDDVKNSDIEWALQENLPAIIIPFVSEKKHFYEKESVTKLAEKRLNQNLVCIDEYIELLKEALNNPSCMKFYFGDCKSSSAIFGVQEKLKKYGIKIDSQRKKNRADKTTIPALIERILEEITVFNNNNNEYCINQTEFKIKDLEKFIAKNTIKDILGADMVENSNVIYHIETKLPSICIPFFNATYRFYEKESVLKFVKVLSENGYVRPQKSMSELYDNSQGLENLITIDSLLEILKCTFPILIGKSTLTSTNLRNKISTDYNEKLYLSGKNISVLKNKIEDIIEKIITNIKIVNISEKYDIGGFMKYNITQEELNVDFINKHYVGKEYIEDMLGHTKSWKSIEKKIPHIRTDLIYGVSFYRKEAIDHLKHIHESCIGKAELAELLNEELGYKFSAYTVFNTAKRNGLTVYYGPPGFYSKNTNNVVNVVSKKDIPRLREILEENILYEDCEDLYSYMKKFLDTKAKPTNKNIKKTLKYFDNYIIDTNNTTRESSAKPIFRTCSQVYDLMNDYLTKELFDYDEDELLELCDTIAVKYPDYVVERFRMFSNYVMDETGQKKKKLSRADDDKEKEKVLPYDLESYFTVLGTLIRFLSNKDDLINKIIDTKSRKNDSSLLYILTHYTACWRSADICAKLPNPNLRLIGFDSGEKFLEWFKKDDSVFTEDMGRLICKDVEYKITSTRACASKNNGKLLLYISPFLYKVYGLLLCICEAKRQRFNGESLLLKSTAKDLTETVNELDIEILESIGLFTNRRANKSFETYICERSEEWNMGIGYLMASVARGHKLNKQLFSETTRVYVNKDVDKMSFMAFSSSVFSGIKYEFLDLIDEDFKENTIEEKSVKATEFGLSNYELEIMLESIAQKQAVIDKFFKENLLNKNTKRKTVVQLFYGKNSTSKHEYAKCLLRAYISAENEEEIDLSKGFVKPCVYTGSKTCIGCPYLIAERYFLYELEIKLTEALNALESATSDFDKKIHLARLKDLFFPIVHEAMKELGAEYVKKVLSVDKMTSMYRQEKQALELKEKHGGMLNVGNHDCRRK